jgi:uncharacterized membrane protein YeaQ/YmgE (transglycosylase-associated protein family)
MVADGLPFSDGADSGGDAPAGSAATSPRGGVVGRWLAGFRRWRRTRPFWGGLLILLAGAEILLTVWAPLRVVLHIGLLGLAGYLVPMVLLICGVLVWFNPVQRVFYALVAVLLTLTSWITSNLGGFLVGLLLGLVGSSLAFAWQPGPRRARSRPGETVI